MSVRRNKRGKDNAEAVGEVEDVREKFSERLFATDRFSSERVNMYSTVDRLLWVRDVLDGTPEMSTFLESCWDLVLEPSHILCTWTRERYVHCHLSIQASRRNPVMCTTTYGVQNGRQFPTTTYVYTCTQKMSDNGVRVVVYMTGLSV
ncbi:hypothetical protein YC2023_032932 [Brassica napus]